MRTLSRNRAAVDPLAYEHVIVQRGKGEPSGADVRQCLDAPRLQVDALRGIGPCDIVAGEREQAPGAGLPGGRGELQIEGSGPFHETPVEHGELPLDTAIDQGGVTAIGQDPAAHQGQDAARGMPVHDVDAATRRHAAEALQLLVHVEPVVDHRHLQRQ
ncbi:MAG: hypothetical protein QM724_11910 [Flavobacteriales bacterium]